MLKKIAYFSTMILIFISSAMVFSFTPDEEDYTLTKPGQRVPEFTVTTLDGQTVNIRDLEGKVVLINFFATWCAPCMAEMPHLEKELWQVYRNQDFMLLAIGREHTAEELIEFNETKKFTFPIAPDSEREIYKKFAIQNIPRNFLINKKGEIVAQETGFTPEEFEKLVNKIKNLLK